MVLTEDWLMVVATILVAWLTLEALAYRRRAVRRAETEPPEGFVGWLAARIRWNWPLLVLLIMCGTEFAWVEGRWVLVGAAVVLGWWVGEAIAVRPIPRTRNPVALFALSMRRLWHNRHLVWILVACWIASAAVTYLFYVRSYRIFTAKHAALAASDHAPSTVEVVRSLPPKLVRCLPQVEILSLGYLGQYLLVPALAFAVIWLFVRTPHWLSEQTRERLHWPLGLTVACVLAQGAFLAYAWDAMWGAASLRGLGVADPLLHLAAYVLAAPAYAVLWHVGIQLARGERWNLRRALQGMAASWAPICILQFVVWLPTSIMLLLSGPPFFGYSFPVYQLGTVLKVMLALAPWIIVDQAVGFRQALVETYRLVAGHAYDVLVFALRFTAMFGVASVLVGLLQPRGLHPPTPVTMIGYVTGDFFRTAQALVIAVLYLELRRERDPVEDASAPVAGAVPQQLPALSAGHEVSSASRGILTPLPRACPA